MKNVAGFDVPRLMTGALGTLGVLVEISVKCQPLPKSETTRLFDCTADEAIRRCNEWAGQPLPVSATCHHEGRLAVRLSGAAPAVKAAVARLGGEALGDADGGESFWRSVRDQTHPCFAAATAAGTPLWRLSVKSTAPHAELGGVQLHEWGGALRWLVAGDGADPARLVAWAQDHGGHATLFRTAGMTPEPFHPLPEALLALHRRLKAVFDPAGILNRGRLHPSF
jgi:glycolate oxidase FAD binding subunit